MLCLNFLWLDYYHIVHWCMCSNLPYKNCKKLKEHMWNLNYKLCAIGISILANRKNTLLFWFMYFFSLRSLNLYISNYYILYLKSVHFTSIKRICALQLGSKRLVHSVLDTSTNTIVISLIMFGKVLHIALGQLS